MAQTGYTPLQIYSSSTGGAAPAAGNLTNSTLGSELAINITDGKLFYKDNAGVVQVIAWKTTPTTAGGTGLTSYTAGDLLYYATGTTLSTLTIGASTNILTSSGSAPQWTAPSTITVGKATNLDGGAAGSVPYQSGAGATTFLGIGAANTVLTSSGSAPQWSTSLTLTTLTATNSILTANNTGILAGTPPNNTLRFTDTDTTAAADQPFGRVEFYSSDTGFEGVKAYMEARATDGSPDGDLYFATQHNTGSGLADKLKISYDGNITALLENLVIGTAAKGINFTANTPRGGMTSQLLNWYEEGTFTPTITGSSTAITLTYTTQTGRYTRVGRLVTVTAYVQVNTISAAGSGFLVLNTGLWNSDGTPVVGSVTLGKVTYTSFATAQMRGSGSSSVVFYSSSTAGAPVIINATDVVSGSQIYVTITYIAA